MSLQIRFGEFVLDERCYALERAGGAVALRPKAFDLLLHLARHRDRVVLRDELVHAVWGETRVGAGSLAGLVNEVRQALGERGRSGGVIRTVHGRGYQFVAAVEEPAAWDDGGWEDGQSGEAGRVPAEDASLDRLVRKAIEQACAIGPAGLLVEIAEGGASSSAAVDALGREAGFDVLALAPPSEAMATTGRLVGDLLSALVEARSRDEVQAALPLPARLWLESPHGERVAGGQAPPSAGLPGGLSAIASAYRRCAARTPILLRVDALDRAGPGHARDLLRFLEALDTAPVLVCATLARGPEGDEVRRLLDRSGSFRRLPSAAPGASKPGASASGARIGVGPDGAHPAPEALRAALRGWCEAWAIEHLPFEIETALLGHLRGDRPLDFVGGVAGAPSRPGLRRVAPRAEQRVADPRRS